MTVAGVSLDEGGAELIRKFIADYKVDYPILIPDAASPFRKLESVPTTLLVDRNGRLANKYTGAVPEGHLRRDLERILAEGIDRP